MKKIYFLFAVSAGLCALSFLAFANNIVAIIEWWRAFVAAGGNSDQMPQVGGFLPWLNWTAVDYSAVTTFIPALGFLCTTLGFIKIIRRKRSSIGDFPFFKGSDQLNVALGLFGTLWGIIVIGYFDLKTVSMADLMLCLHTALFSTLMAVVWVFLIDRPLVRPYFERLLQELELVETDDGDLSAAVERLVIRLGVAADEFEKRQSIFEETSARRQREYEESFEKRLKAYEQALEERHKAFENSFTARNKEYQELFVKSLNDYESALEKRHNAYGEAFKTMLDNMDNAIEERRRQFEESLEKRLASSEKAFLDRYKAYEEAFEKRLAEYSTEFDLRQKEYSEFFKRRIEELEKHALEEKLRADASNAKLAAVTNALR